MGDGPINPDEKEGYLEEIEEGVILDNLNLLELKFVKPKHSSELDEETRLALLAIKNKGSRNWQGKVEHAISITYDTKTGTICNASSNANFGDFSRLNTDLIESQEGSETKRTILLHRQGDMPSADQYSSVLAGEQVGVDMGNRRIQPERIIPEHPELMGASEVWGESQFVDSARGDIIMLRTIRKFNEINGPSR